MMTTIETIKNGFLKYWFVFSSLALAIVVYMLDAKGKKISELQLQIQQQKLAEQLQAISEQSKRSQEDYEKASNNYAALKQRHGDLLTKLGLLPGSNPPGQS